MILFSRSCGRQVAVVVLAGIHLLVERQRQLQHLGARLLQLGLGVGQQLRRLDGSFHHVVKFGRVPFLAQPPGAAVGRTLRQIVLHPRIEVGQRLLGRRRDFVVLRLKRRAGRDLGGHGVHQVEIALVLLHRGRNEDGIGVGRVATWPDRGSAESGRCARSRRPRAPPSSAYSCVSGRNSPLPISST